MEEFGRYVMLETSFHGFLRATGYVWDRRSPGARAEADLQVIDIAEVRCFDDPQEEVDEIEQLKEQQRELRENLLKKRSPERQPDAGTGIS